MPLKTRIFIFFFSIQILTIAASGWLVIRELSDLSRILSGSIIGSEVEVINTLYHSDQDAQVRLEAIMDRIQNIAGESVSIELLGNDLLLRSILSAGGLIFLYAVVTFFLVFVMSRMVTRDWTNLMDGVRSVADGYSGYRFDTGGAPEFRLLKLELNRMLDASARSELLEKEKAGLLSWREAASFLSHQLKNPLAAVRLAGKNMELVSGSSRLSGDEAQALAGESLAIIAAESTRMSELLTRFRDLIPLDELNRESLCVRSLIDDVVSRLPPDADASVRVPSSLACDGDRQYLEQVVLNICTNSIEAAREQVRQPRISIEGRLDGDRMRICFSDDNAGPDDAVFSRLGDVRFTTKAGGSGLGLWLCRRIARLHSGDIAFERSENGGLVVVLELPFSGGAL